MLKMDLPHINVLTKIDNFSKYPDLPFNLDFYTEVQDLNYLLPHLSSESPVFAPEGKLAGLNQAIVDLVEEFGLIGFETLAVEDKKSMMSLLQTIDRASGYAFGGPAGANDTVWQVAVREGLGKMDVRDVQERWLDKKDEWDEIEEHNWQEEAKMREATMMNGGVDEFGDVNIPMNSGIKVTRSSKNS
jgi:GPN-loop GTPase